MKDQLQTIREALDKPNDTSAWHRARQAVAQLEAMVREQKPVANCTNSDAWNCKYCRKATTCEALNDPRNFAAPVAQQPQKLEDIEQYRMQMAGISTAAIGYWKEGDSIHPDYDTLALRDVAKLYAKYDALYKAQQPQARPDFTDEWTGYLKDGETPFERFLRERKDLQSLLKLYQRAIEENESLKAQQPQAKPDIHEAQGQIEFLDRKNNALSAAIRKVMARLADLLDEDQFKEIEETISSAGVQPQAEAVLSDHLFELWWAEYMPEATQARAWAAWTAAPRADGVGVAAPQQAEVVPPGFIAFARDVLADFPHGFPDEFDLNDLAIKHGLLIGKTITERCGEFCNCAEYHGDAELKDGVTCYRRHAAIAQQKGQP